MSKQIEQALRELHTALCGVRQVGEIDGHGVIRRESVLDLVSQRIHSAAQADASAPNPSDKQEAAILQIQRHNGSWLDATQYAYDNTAENRRRIVYLGGQA